MKQNNKTQPAQRMKPSAGDVAWNLKREMLNPENA